MYHISIELRFSVLKPDLLWKELRTRFKEEFPDLALWTSLSEFVSMGKELYLRFLIDQMSPNLKLPVVRGEGNTNDNISDWPLFPYSDLKDPNSDDYRNYLFLIPFSEKDGKKLLEICAESARDHAEIMADFNSQEKVKIHWQDWRKDLLESSFGKYLDAVKTKKIKPIRMVS